MNNVFGTTYPPGERLLIVYDVDDICHPQAKSIAEDLGFDFDLWTRFYVEQIPHLDPVTRRQLRQALDSPKYYQGIQFYNGVEDILKPEELDPRVEVIFSTKSPDQKTAELKNQQLLQCVRGLTSDKITSLVYTDVMETQYKDIPNDTFIFVDDSPYNLGASPAELNAALVKPWNTSDDGLQLIWQKQVYFFATLRQLNDFVYFRTEIRLATGL